MKRKLFTLLIVLLYLPLHIQSQETSSSLDQWRANKYSMFIHFGIYSELGGVWKGENISRGYSEQIQAHAGIYSDEYAAVANRFNPIHWNPDSIALFAKEAGMRSIVITSKHHDGFCMFDSKFTEYDVVDATPYGKDIIKGLAEACNKHGLNLGLYFSIIDWHFPHAYPISSHNADFVTKEHHQYNLKQVEELLTRYGPVSELWFDMGSLTHQQSSELADLVHRLQPDCLVSGRIGNDQGDFNVMGDNRYPDFYMEVPWQTPASIFNATWSYRSWQERGSEQDKINEKLKSLVHVVGQGGNYLLNIGPKGDGSVVPFEANVLKGIGSWLKTNGEAIYDTRANPFEQIFEWGEVTRKEDKLFLLITQPPRDHIIELPGLNNKITRVYPLAGSSKQRLKTSKTSGGVRIHLPEHQSDEEEIKVWVVEYKGEWVNTPEKVLSLSDAGLVLTKDNAKKYYSFSGRDYYTSIKGIVKQAWYIRSEKTVNFSPELTFTAGEMQKTLQITIDGNAHRVSLRDAEKVPLNTELRDLRFFPLKVSEPMRGGFGQIRQAFVNSLLENERTKEWETLSDFKLGVPYSLGSDQMRSRYFLQEIESEKAQEVVLNMSGGEGVQVWFNGTEKLYRQYVNNKGAYTNTLLLRLKKGKNRLLVRVFTRLDKKIEFLLEMPEEQMLFRKKLPQTTLEKRAVSTWTVKLSDPETPHEHIALNNLNIRLLGPAKSTIFPQHQKRAGAQPSFISRNLEWKGIAVEDQNYTIWGCAPIQGEDGKTHLFAARWPEKNVDPAWRKSSEIAHYVADHPEGPFVFSDVAIRGTGKDTWDKYAPHNPEIKKVGDKYVLLYIGNTDYHQPPHPSNQSIGMAISESPYGPWKKVGKDGKILGADDPSKWNYQSRNGVSNPAFLAFNGKYYLYFKSTGKDGLKYGLAIADNLEGPYTISDQPVTSNKGTLEDGTVFYYRDQIYLLTTDNHGQNTGIKGGGTLWKSQDGLSYKLEDARLGYDRLPAYYPDYDLTNVVKIYGPDPKLERPKILIIDGRPAYLYGPGGWNIFGGERTVCHVLKINL